MELKVGTKVEQEFLDVVKSVPKEILKIQGIDNLDLFDLADTYLKSERVADISIDVNANVDGREPVNFQSEIEKPQLKLRSYHILWKKISELYNRDIADKALKAMLDGSLYFHDITKIDMPYCFAFDTSFLCNFGRPYGWLPSKAPKRSSSFIGQLVEITMDMSQAHAGAIGIANILVNLAYYTKNERSEILRLVKKLSNADDAILAIAMYAGALGYSGNAFCITTDTTETIEKKAKDFYYKNKTHDAFENEVLLEKMANIVYDKYLENLLQQFVHVMHNTFRVGGDSPFTNISIFDKCILRDMFGEQIYPDMTLAGDNIEEIMNIQKIFIEFYCEGAPTTGKNYRFPVATVNIKTFTVEDFKADKCKKGDIGTIADKKFFSYICKKNHRRGPFNIHVGEKIASCCRLTSDLAELKNQIKTDSFGNGGISIGSHRVVAINLHRIALKARNNKLEYTKVLKDHVDLAEVALVAHKTILKERVDSGFLKFFNIGWEKLEMFFSTVGYTGIWESYEAFYDKDATTNLKEYTTFSKNLIDYLEVCTKDMSMRNEGFAFNLEEIPGENASPKCAAMDNYLYKNKEWYKPVHLLSNQMVPLYVNVPLFDRLKIEGDLMNKVSGGAILHLNMNETMTDKNYEDFLRMIIEEYKIIHFTINRGTTTCINGHTSIGVHAKCPVCDGEIYTHTIKVVGFNTDTISWTKERRDWEFSHRQFYCSSDILE